MFVCATTNHQHHQFVRLFYLVVFVVLRADGIREKDKKLIMTVLSNVTLMKDQAYHLARHVWNDIHDDWPFYTDQEKQILKRYVHFILYLRLLV